MQQGFSMKKNAFSITMWNSWNIFAQATRNGPSPAEAHLSNEYLL